MQSRLFRHAMIQTAAIVSVALTVVFLATPAHSKTITAGYLQSGSVKADGTVVAWGDNTSGQCNVPPDLSGVVAVDAGFNFYLALQSDDTVVAWGDNTSGQCNVPPDLSGVVAVAAGSYHCLALKADGTVVTGERTTSVS